MSLGNLLILIIVLLIIFGVPQNPFGFSARTGGGYGVPGALLLILLLILVCRLLGVV